MSGKHSYYSKINNEPITFIDSWCFLMSNSFANAMTVGSAESDRSPCMNYLFRKRHFESGLLWGTPSHSPGLYNHWPSLRSHVCPDIQDGWRGQEHSKNTAQGGVCVMLWNFWKTDWFQRANGFLLLFIVEGSLDKTASWQLSYCARQSRWQGRESLLLPLWARGFPGHW